MNLKYIYFRTKDLLFNPENEWKKVIKEVKQQERHVESLLIPYSILMAIGAVIGSIVFNINNLGTGINISSIIIGINAFLLAFLGTYASAFAFDELRNNFTNEKNFHNSLSIIINTLIPYYIFAFFAYIVPQLSVFFTILGLYSTYVFWFAIQHHTSIQQEKKVGFFILSGMIGVIIFFILKLILGSIYLFFTNMISGV